MIYYLTLKAGSPVGSSASCTYWLARRLLSASDTRITRALILLFIGPRCSRHKTQPHRRILEDRRDCRAMYFDRLVAILTRGRTTSGGEGISCANHVLLELREKKTKLLMLSCFLYSHPNHTTPPFWRTIKPGSWWSYSSCYSNDFVPLRTRT